MSLEQAILADSVHDVDTLLLQGNSLYCSWGSLVSLARSLPMMMCLIHHAAPVSDIVEVVDRLHMTDAVPSLNKEALDALFFTSLRNLNHDMIRRLIPVCTLDDKIFAACNTCNLMMVDMLLDAKADPCFSNELGLTPIHLAAMMDDFFLVSTLIEHGANPNVAYESVSPLQTVVMNDNATLAHLLISQRADVNHEDRSRTTALIIAVEHECDAIVRILLENGATVNSINQDGVTPLYNSIVKYNMSLFDLLIDHGANNFNQGVDLLYITTYLNYEYMVLQLLYHGATLSGALVHFALLLAVKNHNLFLCKLFISYGANANACDSNGAHVLQLALKNKELSIVLLLLDHGSEFYPLYLEDPDFYAPWALQAYNDEYLFHAWCSTNQTLRHSTNYTKVVHNEDLCKYILGFLRYSPEVFKFICHIISAR